MTIPWFLEGDGPCRETVRSIDWARTSLGQPETWPVTLQTSVATLFRAQQPMLLMWGPELIQFYNDAFLPSFGNGKHPKAMGQAGRECWSEVWPIVGGQIEDVMSHALPTGNEDALVPIFRNGRIEEVYWTYTYSPAFGPDGGVAGVLVICTETTRRVLAERDAEAASRAKDEFLAMLGHELRNPLAPISTALHLIRRRSGGDVSREHEIIERQVNHLTRLVDDLLDVAKIARGKVELRLEIVDLGDVIAKALEMASDLLEEHHHHLTLDCERGRFFCNGDPMRLAQVVANLLTNAAKYTERGGAVSVGLSRDGAVNEITVRDNGIGIAPDLLPRVFDLFEQGRRTTDREAGGLGIGLALVKNLVTLHEGSASVRSAGVGRGSEFTIRLPAVNPVIMREPEPRRPRGRPAATGRSARILIVDDNVDALELLKELLELSGHRVAAASDPLAALDLAATFSPEIALIDIGLPVLDGYELAARLRAGAATAGCRMIALTGYGQQGDRRRSLEAGFDEHLVKPVDVDQLTALIGTIVGRIDARG